MKSNNVIEINGRMYDAKSGAILSSTEKKSEPSHSAVQKAPAKKTAPVKKVATAKSTTRPRLVDGFSPRRNPAASPKLYKKSATASRPAATTPAKPAPAAAKPATTKTPSKSRTAGPNKVKRSVKKSSTLHRNAVKAPVLRASTPIAEEVTTPAAEPLSSTALKHADAQRLKRAKEVAKSTAVSRFNHAQSSQPEAKKQPTKEEIARSAPLTKQLLATHSSEPEPVSAKERLLQNAVAKAEPTKTPAKRGKLKRKTTKARTRSLATSALVVLLLTGYVAYLNIPSISMKVAAHRAGFAASLPSYSPSGYSIKGPIAYTPGQVTLNFKSNTDDRAFSLKQQPTTWDSTALLENVVTKKTPTYLTYQDKGLTIYIYDGSSAAWVNGGKLYMVEGSNSQLDTDQLLRLATSV